MKEKLENIGYAILEGFGAVMTAYVLAEITAEWCADVDLNKEIDKSPASSWIVNLSLLGVSCYLSYKAYKRIIAAEERLVSLERQLEENRLEIAELKNNRFAGHTGFFQPHLSQSTHSQTPLREIVVHDAANETVETTNVREGKQAAVRSEGRERRSAAFPTFSNLRLPLLQKTTVEETGLDKTDGEDDFATQTAFKPPKSP